MANEPVRPAVNAETRPSPFRYSSRVVLRTILGRPDGGAALDGERVVIGGWVKASRELGKSRSPSDKKDVTCSKIMRPHISPCLRNVLKILIGGDGGLPRKSEVEKKEPAVAYLQVNDGSCVSNLEIVVDSSVYPTSHLTSAGASILVEGVLRKPSTPGKRGMSLQVEKVLDVGATDLDKYPLAKSRLSLEFLRNYCHLRPRKTMVASITRIRSALSYGTHTFFQNHGFIYVNMPIITSMKPSDVSESFQVTTLFGKMAMTGDPNRADGHEQPELKVVKAAIKEKSDKVQELKRNESDKEALAAAIQDLEKTSMLVSQLEAERKSKVKIPLKDGKVDFSHDFYSREAYLIASSKLHLESYACSLSNVYTFGPTFQAEKSLSKRLLAESWMVELEMAFTELEGAVNCAEDYVKYLFRWVLENCEEDMKLVSIAIDRTSIERLHSMISSPFERISYTEAVETLKKITDKTFETQIEWGMRLGEEHESYLVNEVYKRPIVIYSYPKEANPFYVRLNDDGKTVAAFDIIVPKVGTLVKGSQKEERFDLINKRMQELGVAERAYKWYLDIRKHGSARHSGFSLNFEHLVMMVTGISDVRDAIPFSRTVGALSF